MDKKKLKKTILAKIAQLETEMEEIKKLAAPLNQKMPLVESAEWMPLTTKP